MHCLMHILYLILNCIVVEPGFMVVMSYIFMLSCTGCDVITRLKECSFEPSHSLADYSLYNIGYLRPALTLYHSDTSVFKPTADVTPDIQSAGDSTTAAHTDEKPAEDSDQPDSADNLTDMTSLVSLVSANMYKLAFSLCNGLFLPWLDSDLMSTFRSHLDTVEAEIKTSAESSSKLNIVC